MPTSEWPADVLVWLGKAGVRTDRAAELGAGWAPSINRFVLPCVVDGVRTGAFTARSLDRRHVGVPSRPKYVAGGSGMACWIDGDSRTTVFVEDILSAWRVHWAGFRASAVLGTSFDQNVLRAALRGATAAVSWLDPDQAGRDAHRKLRRAMGLWDVPLHRVQSERDPKLHSRLEIQQYIKEALDGH